MVLDSIEEGLGDLLHARSHPQVYLLRGSHSLGLRLRNHLLQISLVHRNNEIIELVKNERILLDLKQTYLWNRVSGSIWSKCRGIESS